MRVFARYLHIMVEELENLLISRYTMEKHGVTSEVLKLQKKEKEMLKEIFKEYKEIKREIRESKIPELK